MEAVARVAIASVNDFLARTPSHDQRNLEENKAWMPCRRALQVLIDGENDHLDEERQLQNRENAAAALSTYANAVEQRIDAPSTPELDIAINDCHRVATEISDPTMEEKLFARILFEHEIASRLRTIISALHNVREDDVRTDNLMAEMLDDVNPKINALIENYYGNQSNSIRGKLKLTDLYK